jgi:hypothetical protein
MKIKKK